jgi:hypothetical protein
MKVLPVLIGLIAVLVLAQAAVTLVRVLHPQKEGVVVCTVRDAPARPSLSVQLHGERPPRSTPDVTCVTRVVR